MIRGKHARRPRGLAIALSGLFQILFGVLKLGTGNGMAALLNAIAQAWDSRPEDVLYLREGGSGPKNRLM